MAFTYTPTVGAIGLVKIRGGAGRLIRVGQFLCGDGYHDYEHAMICVAVHTNADRMWTASCVQAEPDGADIGQYTLKDSALWTDLGLDAATRQKIGRQAAKYFGVPYSAADYLAIAEHRIGLKSDNLKNYIADSGHMICSQLVDQVYTDCGIHLFKDGRWPGYVTPGALYERLK